MDQTLHYRCSLWWAYMIAVEGKQVKLFMPFFFPLHTNDAQARVAHAEHTYSDLENVYAPVFLLIKPSGRTGAWSELWKVF